MLLASKTRVEFILFNSFIFSDLLFVSLCNQSLENFCINVYFDVFSILYILFITDQLNKNYFF